MDPRTLWTSEEDAALRLHIADRLSASQIATTLGNGRSRNSIIGRAHRLGLSVNSVRKVKGKRKRKRNRRFNRGGSTPEQRATAWDEYLKASDLPPDQSERPVRLLNLKPWSCRWPLGDPQSDDFRFCGDRKHGRHSYCARHCNVAFLPLPPRPVRVPLRKFY